MANIITACVFATIVAGLWYLTHIALRNVPGDDDDRNARKKAKKKAKKEKKRLKALAAG